MDINYTDLASKWMMSRFDGAKKEIPDFNWLTWLPEAKQAAITMFLTDCQVIREPLALMTLSGDSTYDIPTLRASLTPSSFIKSVLKSSIFDSSSILWRCYLCKHPSSCVQRFTAAVGASNYCVSLFRVSTKYSPSKITILKSKGYQDSWGHREHRKMDCSS